MKGRILNWQKINLQFIIGFIYFFLLSVFLGFCCDDEQYIGKHSVCGYRYTDST